MAEQSILALWSLWLSNSHSQAYEEHPGAGDGVVSYEVSIKKLRQLSQRSAAGKSQWKEEVPTFCKKSHSWTPPESTINQSRDDRVRGTKDDEKP